MNETQRTGFSERLKTAADAKKALLEKFRPKPTVVDPLFSDRAALRAADLARVREDRAAAKAVARQAAADVEQAKVEAQAAIEASALDAKRGERKERKALTKSEAKAKRDERYAARKARR